MQENPLVTIICLCFNHSNFVVESLNAVMNQKYKNIELIIVDDCSTDDSINTIQKWLIDHPTIPFIVHKNNLGNTKSFNNALQFAKGEYIIDLAADDVLLPECVDLQIKAFQNSSYKNIGIVYGNAELISEKSIFDSYYFPVDSYQKVIKKRTTGDAYSSILSGGDSLCSVSSMVKKSVFEDLNGYDESLAYEDLDFWIRASRKYEFDFIDEILVQKRIVTNSLGSFFFQKNHSNSKKINRSTYTILKKAFQLNRSKVEDLALQKRVHFEIILCWKNKQYDLLLKNLSLITRLTWRQVMTKNAS